MSGEDSLAASSVRSKEGEMNSQDSQGASYASGDTPSSDSPLNLRRLMQHLGKNGDKRKAGDGVRVKGSHSWNLKCGYNEEGIA